MTQRHIQDTSHHRQSKLTTQQRQLVSDNLGLVAVHIKRFVKGLNHPRRDREWDDLFQEGCLGLIDAARRYGREHDMPFASFALPRIRNAVNKALHNYFNTIYVPPKQQANQSSPPIAMAISSDDTLTQIRTVDDSNHADHTIGDHIRHRYVAAVSQTATRMMRQRSTRGDRAQLIRTIIKQRLMIPDEDDKTGLRQIARDTQSSYARVAQCEKQFIKIMRDVLKADEAFRILARHAKSSPLGMDHPIDEALTSCLHKAGDDLTLHRRCKADPTSKASHSRRVKRTRQGRQTPAKPRNRRETINENHSPSRKNTCPNREKTPRPPVNSEKFHNALRSESARNQRLYRVHN